ncbi:MAG: TonB-dependent siderophore receptor [Opitutales bacterium]
MHRSTPNSSSRFRGFFFLAFFATAGFALAQTDTSAPGTPPPTATPTKSETENEKIVKMEAFTVSSDIATYHQATSSMATKLPMDTKEIASSLSVMDSTAITDRNAVALTDVFNYVVGATQSQGNINGFSFRGFPNTGSYTQNIQFDGLQGATLKKAATSAADVDSLEFLKGPNGVLYGQMNPGGLLNIVTKSPEEIRQGYLRFTVGTYAGAFNSFGNKNTYTASIDTTGPVGNSKHLFYRLITDIESTPQSRPGDTDRASSLYPSLTYKWSGDTYLTVKGEVSQDFRRQDDGVMPIFTGTPITVNLGGTNTSTAGYGPTATWYTAPLNTVYNNSSDKATDRGEAISAFFHTVVAQDWTVRAQTRSVWHLDVVRELTINNAAVYSPKAAYATPTSKITRQYNYVKNGHRYNYFDANAFRMFTLGKLKQTFIFGFGGGKEFFGNARLAFGPNQTSAQAITLINPIIDATPGIYPADGTGVTNQQTFLSALGEYVSDQIVYADRLHLSLGLRHDYQKVNGSNVLSPALTTFANTLETYTRQAGLVYDVTKNISPYVSWSQSVKPQTTIAYDSSGNSNFPPESGEQYEGGVKFENDAKTLNLTGALYEINRTNVVVASGTNFTVATGTAQVGQAISRLDGKQTSKGYELEAQWQPIPNWQLQAGYAYSHAFIAASVKNPTSIGLDLANAPRSTGNFWNRYNFPANGSLKGLGVGLGVIYVGEAWAGDPTTSLYYQLPAWTRVDAAIYYKWKGYDLALNIQNLADRRYIASAQSATTLNIGEQRKFTLSIGRRF